MRTVLYRSRDDGSFYSYSDVDGGTSTGNSVDGYTSYAVENAISLTPDDFAIGQNDLLQVLLLLKNRIKKCLLRLQKAVF